MKPVSDAFGIAQHNLRCLLDTLALCAAKSDIQILVGLVFSVFQRLVLNVFSGLDQLTAAIEHPNDKHARQHGEILEFQLEIPVPIEGIFDVAHNLGESVHHTVPRIVNIQQGLMFGVIAIFEYFGVGTVKFVTVCILSSDNFEAEFVEENCHAVDIHVRLPNIFPDLATGANSHVEVICVAN